MEGIKEQKAHAEETAHEQIADKDQKGFAEKVSDTAYQVGAKASEVGHQVGVKASEITHQVGEKASEVGVKACEITHQVGEKAAVVGAQASELGHKAYDKMSEAAEATKHAAQGAIVGSTQAVRDARDGTAHEMDKAWETVKWRAGRVKEALTDEPDFNTGVLQQTEAKDLQGNGADKLSEPGTGQLHGVDQGTFPPHPIKENPADRPLLVVPDFHPGGLQHAPHPEQGGITESIKNTAASAATKVSETAGAAKDTVVQTVHNLQEGIANGSTKETVVQKVHSLQEGIANAGHSAYETTAHALSIAKETVVDTAHALSVAKDKVVDTASKAKELVVGAPERKGSVPDASQEILGLEKPHEEANLLEADKDKAFTKPHEELPRVTKATGFD